MCAVVVSYNIGQAIRECVDSIRDQVAEVMVVDNGSGQETLDELDRLAQTDRIRIIRNARNEGIARALNQGVRHALARGHEWVLTLDHDSEATPGMVYKLLRAYQATGSRPAIYAANPWDRNAGTFWAAPEHSREVVEVSEAISSGSLIHRTLFETVGAFDESLFIYYVDVDFCVRARKLGVGIYLCPSAVLIHSEGRRETRRYLGRPMPHIVYGKEAHYFLSRNAICMLRRYGSHGCSVRHILKRLVTDSAKVALYDERKVPKLLYRLRGLWDGMRGRNGPLTDA